MKVEKFTTKIGGKELTFEIGKLAEQATGAVTVRYGDTVVLATAVVSGTVREGIDYFPFMIDYEEKMYASGKIKGSRFIKREGRPSDKAVLTGRLVDRPLRPLFNKYLRNDVQVIITVLSADLENDPVTLATNAASATLVLTGIPFKGPIGAVRVGMVDDKFVLNPTYEQVEEGKLDLTVAGTKEKVLMAEAAVKELPEEKMLEAIEFGHQALKPLVEIQEKIKKHAQEFPKDKLVYAKPEESLENAVQKTVNGGLDEIVESLDRDFRHEKLDQIKESISEQYQNQIESGEISKPVLMEIIDDFLGEKVREKILKEEVRPDGRKLDEIRPINCEVGVLPRTHGSGLFTRGQTQVLSITTLGSVGDEQIIDDMDVDKKKRFFHHYNFPPYSVGEVAPLRGPSRRDIGHGDLVERAFELLIPPKDNFPYTVRVVSEVLSSNGSSSMASICGTSLSLMDAGVKISPVSGIAMGLVTDGKSNKILSDIQGIEDVAGDMDFKVAGTQKGITALQFDLKIEGIDFKLISEILKRSKASRAFILGKMLEALKEPRRDFSPYAPRVFSLKVKQDQIRNVIGKGGETINKIIDETGVEIDIDDEGLVTISSPDSEACEKALDWVKNLTREVEVGEVFKGKVTGIKDFGAFVEILPGQEGLLHISEIADRRIDKVEDVLKLGGEVKVMVIDVDNQGRIKLSKRVVDSKNKKDHRVEGKGKR
ncbi:polyribonucleotide nucleotidyltransferase [Patescibacteria group bacterium]|nr:MAG: polyribonucleotide nucleotidyltransferase [Patescibacteria group bacterium]